MAKIEKLKNEFPDSVAGETSAGPIEIAAKLNEVIEVVNSLTRWSIETATNTIICKWCDKEYLGDKSGTGDSDTNVFKYCQCDNKDET